MTLRGRHAPLLIVLLATSATALVAGGGAVDLGDVFNARQVGGLQTSDGRTLKQHVLIRAGHLARVDCGRLEALGVSSVIDLRTAPAAESTPDASCVKETTTYYLANLPKLLPPTRGSYLRTLDAAEPKLDEIFSQLAREGGVPAVIHCVIGRDRASLVTALVLLALGVSEDRVLDDFEQNQDSRVATSANWMSGVLARIERAGGIEAYLGSHGVTTAQLEALRAQALE
jgi:protein-tyrosine phosphatase